MLSVKGLLGKDILTKVLIALVVLLAAPYVFKYIDVQPDVPKHVVDMAKEPLGIKDLVRSVKRELAAADSERLDKDEASLFKLDRFELEINFLVENRSKGGVSIAPQFVVVDKETEISTQRIHKIKILMDAVADRSGQRMVSGEKFTEDTATVHLEAPPPGKESKEEEATNEE